MRITYFSRDRGACSYYRVELPNDTLKNHKLAKVSRIEKGDNVKHIGEALDADLVVIPRVSDEKFVSLIKQLQETGIKVAVEYDDFLFDISPLSPHYTDYGDKEVEIEIEGEKVKLWEDGKNIDLKLTAERRACVKEALRTADFAIVTTDKLKAEYSKYAKNIAVLPNCIDMNLWQPLPLKKNGEVRLYWAGGASHYEDWCLLDGALQAIMTKYPQVKLVIMGQKFDGTLAGIPKDRIEYHEWVDCAAYPYKTAILNADIALIPLQDTRFNRCKSAIKWIEQAAMGVPAVVSMVTPYQEMFDGENAVMIADNTTDQWIKGISMLVEDPILRAKIGGAAQKYAKAHYDINTQYPRWIEAYKRFI